MASTTARTFTCDECGRSFPTKQALGGHKSNAHKNGKPERAPVARPFSVTAQVAEAMREVVAPLRLQHSEIDAQIKTKQFELGELRTARTQLESVLRKLDPAAFKDGRGQHTVDNGARRNADKLLAKKTDTLRILTQEHPELFANGVTANSLAETWKNLGLQPAASLPSIRASLETLRDEGIMRADRIVKGGGMSWKLVTDNGGAPDGP